MPRASSECLCNPNESLESVLQRCPSRSLVTPIPNKPVIIRPLKRSRDLVEDGPASPQSPEPEEQLNPLSPRKLDMDQEVVLASQLPADDEEDERVETTQPWPPTGELEEGEIPVLARTDGASQDPLLTSSA